MRVNTTRQLPALLIVAAFAGCTPAAEGPPEILVDETACAHCTMLVSEPRFAAAYRLNGVDKAFDDITCLLDSLAEEPPEAEVRLWFRDVRDGAWITPGQAMFARTAALRTPMAGGVVASADATEIDRLTNELGAAAYASFAELRADHASFARQEPGRRER